VITFSPHQMEGGGGGSFKGGNQASLGGGGGSHGEPFNLSHSLVEEQEKQISYPFEQNSRLLPRSERAKRYMGQGRHHF